MKRYVLGFCFNQELDRVALILKDHPANQAGKLNGIGGKIENSELPHQAMTREFLEEAGVEIEKWNHVKEWGDGVNFNVSIYTTVSDLEKLSSTTPEQIALIYIDTLNAFKLVDQTELFITESLKVLNNAIEDMEN